MRSGVKEAKGVIKERGTSQLVHCESNNMKVMQLFALVLYCIDFVSGKDSAVVKVYCIKKLFYKNFHYY